MYKVGGLLQADYHCSAANDERLYQESHTRTAVEIRSASFERIPNLFSALPEKHSVVDCVFCIMFGASALFFNVDVKKIIWK
ncbi:hypothetical protein Scep_007780 [Stephania cephalantha]|uniref:Uncharacterized protein n=1 Tax=Stephania cephalantha TaxID=152367 RepID=A0AAP0KAH6_9MAGN